VQHYQNNLEIEHAGEKLRDVGKITHRQSNTVMRARNLKTHEEPSVEEEFFFISEITQS